MQARSMLERVGESAQAAASLSSASADKADRSAAAAGGDLLGVKAKLVEHVLVLTAHGVSGERLKGFVDSTTNEFLILSREVVDAHAHFMPSGMTKNILMGRGKASTHHGKRVALAALGWLVEAAGWSAWC